MATPDPELIRRIADEVMKHLGDARDRAATPSAARAPQAIQPPAGVCTGDYGQFTDRPDLVRSAAKSDPAPAPEPDAPAPPTALSGIITASQLEEAVARDGRVRLAANARLTPLAADYVREHSGVVQRLAAGESASASAATGRARKLLWIDGHCPTVQKLVASHGSALQVSAAAKSEAGLIQAIRDISAGVASGTLAGGVLFVRDAALPVVAANRVANLRAVVGTCPDTVRRAIDAVAANVLIVEYLYTSADRITAMAEVMLAADPRPRAVLQRQLAELARPV